MIRFIHTADLHLGGLIQTIETDPQVIPREQKSLDVNEELLVQAPAIGGLQRGRPRLTIALGKW